MFTLDDVEIFLEDVLAALKARKKVPALEAEIQNLRSELAAANKKYSELSAHINELRDERSALRSKNIQLENKIAELTE